MKSLKLAVAIGLTAFVPFNSYSQEAAPKATQTTSPLNLKWSAFVDSYYAYDFNSPDSFDRAYTTQPARHNEFNINLAHIDATIESDKLRGRLALQAGTSVQNNYSSEPANGSISGPSLARHIQEARAGYRLSDKLWFDGGIFFAHVGGESWISRDNLTLTRSLVADYSPYYLSGVKFTYAWSEQLTLQLLVTNGWQNISETNDDKNIGTSIAYNFGSWAASYNAMFGNEVSPELGGQVRPGEFRHFHNFLFRGMVGDKWEWLAQFDFGFQNKPTTGQSNWFGTTLMARWAFADQHKLAMRIERFHDRDQVVIVTNTPNGFEVNSASLGIDSQLENNLVWRNEVRYYNSADAIFPKDSTTSKTDTVLTTSLALTL